MGAVSISLLFSPLYRVLWWEQEDRTTNAGYTHTRKWNPDRVRREENVSRVPPWGKGDARGKNKKVRTAGTIVPAFLWRAAGDAAAMARTMHKEGNPLSPVES